MDFTGTKHTVYKKDAEDSTYLIAESVYQNEILQYLPMYNSVDKILTYLHTFKTRPDDVWIIDYPRSGTHWMNEILNILTRNRVTIPLKEKQERMVELMSDYGHFDQMESPRLINTHIMLPFMPSHILGQSKIIYMLRNPKSVAVSYYYLYRNISTFEYDGTFAGYLPAFCEGMDDLYGTWFEAVTQYWTYLNDKPNAFFVVYEDLLKNPAKVIKDVSDFLDYDHDISFCEQVAKQANFDAMRKREQEILHKYRRLKGGMCRKGTSTDWKTHFTVAQNEMFDAIYEEKMNNYPELREKIKFS